MTRRRPAQTIPASELNRNFGRIQDEIADEPLIVTHRGRPRLAILSYDVFETLDDASDEAVQKAAAVHQRKLQAVLDNIDEGYMSLDRDWRYRTVNRVAELYLGHAREDLVGAVWTEAFPSARGSEAEAQLRRVMEHGVIVRFEWASVVHPGRKLDVRAFPLPLPDGGVGVVFSNLGERAVSEQQAREAEAYAAALHAVLDEPATLVYDADAIVRRWSDGATALLGWTAEEMVGASVERIFSPASLEAGAPWNEMARARREGRATLQSEHVTKDGSLKIYQDRVVPIGTASFLKLLVAPEAGDT